MGRERVPKVPTEPSVNIPISSRFFFRGETAGLEIGYKNQIKAQIANEREAGIRGKYDIVKVPENDILYSAASIARQYLKEEFAQAGVSSEGIEDLTPVFAMHEQKKRKRIRGTSRAGVPIIFLNAFGSETRDRQMIVQAHEMSHAAATTIAIGYEDGIWREYFKMGLQDESVYNRTTNKSERIVKPTFLEDVMATWDEIRVAGRLREAGLLEPLSQDALNNIPMRIAIDSLRKNDVFKVLSEEELEFFVLDGNHRIRNALSLGIEMDQFMLVRELAYAIGKEESKASGQNITSQEAVERGRRVLQRSRFADTEEAKVRLIEIFGKKNTDMIFNLPQDPVISLRKLSSLVYKTLRKL